MTGNDHYMTAERLLALVTLDDDVIENQPNVIAAAQVHATLAMVYACNRAQTEAYGLLRAMLDEAGDRREAAEPGPDPMPSPGMPVGVPWPGEGR